MRRTWTSRLWQVAAAATLGAACWALAANGALAQSTGSSDYSTQDEQTQDDRDTARSSRGSGQSSSSRSSQDDADDTEGTDRGTPTTRTNRSGTSDYGANRSSSARGAKSGFGSTQTGRDARSDAESGTEYNYGSNPAGAFNSNRFSGSRANPSGSTGTSRNRSDYDQASSRGRGARSQARDDSDDDTRDYSRDAIGEARDDMRRTTRSVSNRYRDDDAREDDARDDDDNERNSSRSRARGSNQSNASRDRDDDSDSRGGDRDDWADQRQFSRDNQGESDRDFDRDERGSTRSSTATSSSSQAQINRAADIGLWFNNNTNNGLVISDVASSGPIARFGFREGDRILSVNGTRVNSEQQFLNYLISPQHVNQRAQVIVWRNNQQVPLWVEPWVLTQHYSSSVAQTDPLETYGVILDDRYSYPVVWKVLPRSAAYYAGIRPSDVIVAWNRQYVYNPEDLTTLVQQGGSGQIPVQVSRNRQLRQLTLDASDAQTSRTALRPDYDSQGFNGGTQRGQTYSNQGAGQQQGATYNQGTYYQGTQLQSGGYGQTGTGYSQQGATTQAGTYGQTGYGQTGYGQATGSYNQQQTGGVLNRAGGLFPRLRDR